MTPRSLIYLLSEMAEEHMHLSVSLPLGMDFSGYSFILSKMLKFMI